MTAEHDQALPVGTQLGDYRLDALIGHGGFGITYRAFDTQLAKFVAIKEYMPVEFATRRPDGTVAPRSARYADDFAWGRERFLDEARALARFRHVHIVPVLRYFEANGTAYTVMEFEDGHSVAQILRQPGRRLQPDEVRSLTEGMLSGLGAVHAQGFLHRDIKPSNVIVRRDGVPILIDFGAARQAMGGRTRTLTSILTPQYAPIEQYAMDGKQGPWTDIYSTAAVLHHAIAGFPPPEAVSRVGSDPYRPLAVTHADRFDGSMLSAIDRGLAFAPEQRPQTISEWRTLFGASLPRAEDAPTQRMATPVSASPRLGGVNRPAEEPAERNVSQTPPSVRQGALAPALADHPAGAGRHRPLEVSAPDSRTCLRHTQSRDPDRDAGARACRAVGRNAGDLDARARARARVRASAGAGDTAAAARRIGEHRAEGRSSTRHSARRVKRVPWLNGRKRRPAPHAPWRARPASWRRAPVGPISRTANVSPTAAARAMSARSPTASGRVWGSPNWAMANDRPATGAPTG